MSDLSTYFGNKIVRWLAGEAMPSAPADLYLALYDGDPKGAGVEVTTDVLAAGRLPIVWDVPASGTVNVLASDADVDYGLSDGAADITHVAVFDAQAAGNRLASKALASPVSVIVGTAVNFLAGDLVFTIGD